ncbi:hypothetical protein [Nocardioides sp. 1609]|uniref:hypothetical protein n=1 Tax=Nocardioides sp. 1609 TaxID=2508327 RepID=UPI0010702A9D|nr:hypothetical protein [Nocardioides sp. 1609]
MRVEFRDVDVTPDEYARMLISAVETRVVAALSRLPPETVLRPPEAVAELVVAVFERERERLIRDGRSNH